MTIIFYKQDSNKIYLCTETEPMKKIDSNDKHIMDYIPNDDILYIENAHMVSKKQFGEWLKGDMKLETPQSGKMLSERPVVINDSGITHTENSKFIHTRHNGTVLIEDIQTERFPEGIILQGKWDFKSVDEIGADTLEESRFYKILLKNRKIEVVDLKYVKENAHKRYRHQSQLDREYDRILIKNDRPGSADAVAARGGLSGEGAVPIEIG